MKELWTGINNDKSEAVYTVRFKTNSKYDYQLVQEYCRKVLDGAFETENATKSFLPCPGGCKGYDIVRVGDNYACIRCGRILDV